MWLDSKRARIRANPPAQGNHLPGTLGTTANLHNRCLTGLYVPQNSRVVTCRAAFSAWLVSQHLENAISNAGARNGRSGSGSAGSVVPGAIVHDRTAGDITPGYVVQRYTWIPRRHTPAGMAGPVVGSALSSAFTSDLVRALESSSDTQ